MPAARKVVTRSPKRTVGLINCRWFQNQPIEHESRLEKHFVYRALLCPGLSKIQHQPFRLQLEKSGKYYTPDFLLFFTDGSHIVVEVKRSEKVKHAIERFSEISRRLPSALWPELEPFVSETLIEHLAFKSPDPADRQVGRYFVHHLRGTEPDLPIDVSVPHQIDFGFNYD